MSRHQPPRKFDLDDFRQQIETFKATGSTQAPPGRLPGIRAINTPDGLGRVQGILDSMTPEERRNPQLITPGRRRRIASGAGVEVGEVDTLLRQFAAVVSVIDSVIRREPREAPVSYKGADRTAPPLNRYNWSAFWNIQRRNLLLWDFVADD